MTQARPAPDLEQLMIDAIRVLSMDAVQKAGCGHPGTPMALAPLGYELFTRHLRHNPANPGWIDRDRFVLSPGHASMLIYSLLHLSGYDLSAEEIEDFRQWGSPTPGHPEVGHTPGVETTTGPLGQGITNSVGMALTERWLAQRFNRPGHDVVSHWTYAVCSDGDLQEGISHEAAAFAGHQELGKLIWVFDDNRITIEGATDLSCSADQEARFRAYGWHVQGIDDGNDLEAIDGALRAARAETTRPSFIRLRTTIGYGSPNMAGSEATHGAALGPDEVAAAKENLAYPSQDPFWIDGAARDEFGKTRDRGIGLETEWKARFQQYRDVFPAEAAELVRTMSGSLPAGWKDSAPSLEDAKDMPTRAASGKVLQGLAAVVPELIGGSADLGGSNKTDISGALDPLASTPDGRVIHFGIREHAMGGILNGMALHGGVRPFGGTFLIFSDYMRPSIRLASLMGQSVIYVFTHDSVGLGEDGPTHQPIEHLMALRAMPRLMDLRPADPAETAVAWAVALERADGPSFLALSRQTVPALPRSTSDFASAEGLRRGGYVLAEADGGEPSVTVLASGSEVHLALEARERLQKDDVPTRVVSLPSWYLFQAQSGSYRREVIPTESVRISIEAGATLGWERWIGSEGAAIGIDRFGASAPWERLYRELGVTTDAVVEQALARLGSDRPTATPA